MTIKVVAGYKVLRFCWLSTHTFILTNIEYRIGPNQTPSEYTGLTDVIRISLTKTRVYMYYDITVARMEAARL